MAERSHLDEITRGKLATSVKPKGKDEPRASASPAGETSDCATRFPSTEPEKSQHEEDDDNGTHYPNESVHERLPLLARRGTKRGKPAPVGPTPKDSI